MTYGVGASPGVSFSSSTFSSSASRANALLPRASLAYMAPTIMQTNATLNHQMLNLWKTSVERTPNIQPTTQKQHAAKNTKTPKTQQDSPHLQLHCSSRHSFGQQNLPSTMGLVWLRLSLPGLCLALLRGLE